MTGPEGRRRRGGGFTLIELVAVLVVIAILAITAAPAMNSVAEARGSFAGKQLLRDLTFARQRAVATGVRTWVAFDDNAETWTVLAENPLNPGRANAVVLTDIANGGPFVTRLGSDQHLGIAITAVDFDGGAEIGFDWMGRPLNDNEQPLAAAGAVTLTDNHQVAVTPVTGHVAYVAP